MPSDALVSPSGLRATLARLAERRYPGVPGDLNAVARTWEDVFADVEQSALDRAVDAYIRVGKFWPMPAEIYLLLGSEP